jgi:hypothetical protein
VDPVQWPALLRLVRLWAFRHSDRCFESCSGHGCMSSSSMWDQVIYDGHDIYFGYGPWSCNYNKIWGTLRVTLRFQNGLKSSNTLKQKCIKTVIPLKITSTKKSTLNSRMFATISASWFIYRMWKKKYAGQDVSGQKFEAKTSRMQIRSANLLFNNYIT